ncbi:MAG: YIP1 family protein [Acidiferrobacteraceae bacterium]
MTTSSRNPDLRRISDCAAAIITSPASFYRTMPKTGGFLEPLMFVIVMGFVSGFLVALGFILGRNPMEGVIFAIGGVVTIPIAVTIVSFVWSAALFVVWRLLGAREPFEVAYRALAYTSAISPITTVLALAPYVGFLGGLTSFFWTLYLLIVASIEVYRIPPRAAYATFIVLALAMLTLVFIAGSEQHGVLHSFAMEMLKAQRAMGSDSPSLPHGTPKAS